jgi:Chromosome segregation ATPases
MYLDSANASDQDEELEEHSSKRARVGTQENSQLTESTKPPSQTLDRDLQSLEKNIIQMKHIHASEKAQLQAELAQANSRFQEIERSLGILQHRYETRAKELHATRQERDRVTESKPSLEQRVEKQKETISSLKEERTELKRELDEARKALKNGGGSTAELETAHEEIRRLVKENLNLERKAEFEKNQSEYMREQYQTASTAAAQSGTESRLLAAENEKLKRKAESNVVQLRELHMKDESVRHLARIEELELTLATRDEFLRRKEDELREIRKNRPSTRSTSTQPRSPKWAGSRPTSPGVGHNGNGNGGLGGRGSALRYSSEMPF